MTTLETDIQIAIDTLKSNGCSEIYLFGSVARGTQKDASDIDIAVRGLSPRDFFFVYGELITKLTHDLDLVDLDLQRDLGNTLTESGELRRVA